MSTQGLGTWSRPAFVPLLAAAILAGGLRFPGLALRPMHADEAVLADKSGTLIEKGDWRYDPRDHHGPLLPYATLATARAAGRGSYAALDEALLRAIPAVCGFLLVLAPLLVAGSLGGRAATWAILLAAVSPALVYYSRYYIPETLLALFSFLTFACLWNAARAGSIAWSLAAGVSAGLALAAKETAILHLAVMALALVIVQRPGLRIAVSFVAAAAAAAALLFTSFGAHPGPLVEWFASYHSTYLQRAFGAGPHVHPWHYYLGLLVFFRRGAGPLFSEAAILLLALAALAPRKGAPGTDRRFSRFLGLYSAILLGVYSLIPYKTPWCLIGFWQPMAVLAGIGAAALIEAIPNRAAGSLAAAACLAACGHLAVQAWLASFRYSAEPENPFVYAHTGRDVFRVRDRMEALAAADPRGRALPVQVFSRANLWPLPWYLRSFPNQQWWPGVPEKATAAPVILATPDAEDAVTTLLYENRPPGERELYMRMFDRYVELRPGVELRGYVVKSLWDKLPSAGEAKPGRDY